MLEEHASIASQQKSFLLPGDHCPAFIDTKRRPDDDRLQMTTLDLEAQSATRANPRTFPARAAQASAGPRSNTAASSAMRC
jgi:hypothetical protein